MNEILSKLTLLARQNGTRFGVPPFVLNPPLPRSEVAVWEAEHSVELPEDYRYFITNIGNGGYSGHGDMFKLEDWWWHLVDTENERKLWPSALFAYEPPTEFEGRCTPVEVSANSSLPPFAGTIGVADEGCGCLSILVLGGTLRGRVCMLDLIDHPYLYPQPDFLSWYEAGLNAQLSINARNPNVNRLP